MDGMIHGPDGEDCCITEELKYPPHEFELDCGHPCPCGGIIHWQPIYGGYFFRCDGCDETGINAKEIVEAASKK